MQGDRKQLYCGKGKRMSTESKWLDVAYIQELVGRDMHMALI